MSRPHPSELPNPRPAVARQWKLVRDIFKAQEPEFKHLFGIEWIVTLLLSSIQFIFPTLYVRHFLGKTLHRRKMAIEIWVILKPTLILLLLCIGRFNYFTFVIGMYLLSDLYAYLLGLIFLRKFHSAGISKGRSLLLLNINFIESNLGFSLLYMSLNCLKYTNDLTSVTRPFEGVYFSFVTSATIGYGDIISLNRLLVIIQITASFIFASIILSEFLGKSESKFEKEVR